MKKRARTGKQYFNPQTGRYSGVPYAALQGTNFDFGSLQMLRESTSGRPYAQLDKFNTNTEKLFKTVCSLQGTGINTQVQKEIHMPIQTLPDGTAIIPEIIKVIAYWMAPAVTTAIESQSFALFIDGPGTEAGGNAARSDCTILTDTQYHYFDHTATEAYDAFWDQASIYDLTDGAGNGLQITQNMTAWFQTTGWDTAADFALHIIYKQRMMSTAAYVAQRSYQRGENR